MRRIILSAVAAMILGLGVSASGIAAPVVHAQKHEADSVQRADYYYWNHHRYHHRDWDRDHHRWHYYD